MSSFRSPDLLERRNDAAAVKEVMLEKFRATRQDPAIEQRRLIRIAVNEARASRVAEREAAKKARDPELAAQAARADELAARRDARPRRPRHSLRLKRPNAMRHWPRRKKPSATRAMQPQGRKKDAAPRVLAGFAVFGLTLRADLDGWSFDVRFVPVADVWSLPRRRRFAAPAQLSEAGRVAVAAVRG